MFDFAFILTMLFVSRLSNVTCIMPRFTRLVTEMDGDGMANMKWNQTWRAKMKTTPNLKFTLVKSMNVGPLNDAM